MQQVEVDGVVVAWHEVGENFIIRNNVSTGSFEQGYDITTGTNVLMENNRSSNNRAGGIVVGHTARNVTIRYHQSSGEPTANTASTLKISTTNVLVEYSTFVGGPHNKPVVLLEPSMHAWAPRAENITLRNNVFVWDHSASGNFFNFTPAVEMQTFAMYNNIFVSRSASQAVMRFGNPDRPPSHPTYTVDHNLYHSTNGLRWSVGSASGITFPTYQSTFGRDVNGMSANPLFMSLPIGDFRLQTGSPALDNGWDFGLAWDLAANPVPQGSGRDIGAYEGAFAGLPGPDAPSDLTATAVSRDRVDLTWVDNADNENQFRIERRSGAEPFGLLTTKGANATSHSDTTVTHATTYTYRVQAQNADGVSTWSNDASATTPVSTILPLVFDNPALRIIEVVTPRSPTHTTLAVNNAVGGTVLRFNFRDLSVPNHAIVGVDVPATQVYGISLRIRRDQWQGIHQLSIDGIDQGTPFDGWISSGGNFLNVNLGSCLLSEGERQFKFELVGKNPSKDPANLDFQLMIDTITLTPIDTTPPVLTLPSDITTEATGPTGAIVIYSATARDDFDGNLLVTTSHPSGSLFPLGTTTVTASAIDKAGHLVEDSFSITVVDTTPPDLVVPENMEIEATGPTGAVVNYTASAFDLVSGAVALTSSHSSGSTFPIGETTVTLSAADAAGNSASESFTVTVVDTTAPVIHSVSTTPHRLWPVDGRMVAVNLTVVVSDAVDAAPVTEIVAIDCNEPANATNSDPQVGDWQVTGPLSLELRATRTGSGSGRLYTITVKSTDSSGNASFATTGVLVPHDERP